MAKTYTEKLGVWLKHKSTSKRDKNLASFLAVRDDIREALAAGFTLMAVWTNLCDEGRIELGYDAFLNYVSRYIRRDKRTARSAPPAPTVKQPVGPAKPADATMVEGFTFNPTPNKEDLL